ncbi:DUF1697 domain-containing protein [Peterkaempfera griseoplana]|uniref:DUF1697 domain-containing protein n=1 Tax=Peterkaempfera griseoplana TaxID=66896 RepID=UPI0007C7591A|nr:DUF1697 domain-containing protein [Peterkaempfera griseoplana]
MTRYVALLRGINLGTRNRVAMADLRDLLGGLGYEDVRTHLQSGNAVFAAPGRTDREIAAAVEQGIAARLGLTVPVVVRTAAELRAVVDGNPMDVPDPAKFLVSFLAADPGPVLPAGLDPAAYAPEEMRLVGRHIYLNLPDGVRNAKLPLLLERRLAVPATTRNWSTVVRLLALAEE